MTTTKTQWEITGHVNGRQQTRRQIGWFIVKEEREFQWAGAYAADYGSITVQAGRYPLYALRDCGQRWHSLAVSMPGVVKSGSWWNKVEPGTPRDAHLSLYPHSVAHAILSGQEAPFELLPDIEARQIDFEYAGQPSTTHGLFDGGEQF